MQSESFRALVTGLCGNTDMSPVASIRNVIAKLDKAPRSKPTDGVKV